MTTKTSTSTLPETKKTKQKNDGKTQRPSPASRRSATTSPAGQGSSARVSSRSRESGGGLFYRFLASLFAFRLFSPSSLSPPSRFPQFDALSLSLLPPKLAALTHTTHHFSPENENQSCPTRPSSSGRPRSRPGEPRRRPRPRRHWSPRPSESSPRRRKTSRRPARRWPRPRAVGRGGRRR